MGLGIAAYAVLRPFLAAIAWGAILAYVVWPLYRRLPSRESFPNLSAMGGAVAVAVGVGLPVAFVLGTLAAETASLAAALREWQAAGAPLPAWLADSSLLHRAQAMLTDTFRIDASELRRLAAGAGLSVSKQVVALGGGVVANAFTFGTSMVMVYAFLRGGERLTRVVSQLAQLLFPVAPQRFLESIGESVRAVMYGMVGTALTQGLLTGIGLAVAGVPSPVAFGTVAVFIAILPGGGSAVSVVSAIWLALTGHLLAGAGLGLWGVLVVGSVDNFLRPLLISGRGSISFVQVFLGVLGGLAAFGLLGAFLGPVILSVATALVSEFARLRGATAAPADASA